MPITSNAQLREAAFEGPPMLSGNRRRHGSELRRRIALEEHPGEAAQLDEAEEAVAVANAAINMVAAALQTAAGFEGNEHAFANWMAESSAAVEREIVAAKSKPNSSLASMEANSEQLKVDIGREIDRIFQEAFPSVFKSAA